MGASANSLGEGWAAFSYMQEDRGHQRLRVIEVENATGTTRNLVDEKTKPSSGRRTSRCWD